MTRHYSLIVQGTTKTWSFSLAANPSHVEDWQRDGLIVEEIVNTVPAWLPAGLTRLWCIAQDIFYLRIAKK